MIHEGNYPKFEEKIFKVPTHSETRVVLCTSRTPLTVGALKVFLCMTLWFFAEVLKVFNVKITQNID